MGATKAQGEWSHGGERFWGRRGAVRWAFLPFGLLSPLIGAALGILFIVLGLWLLKFANMLLLSPLIALFMGAVARDLPLFFGFFLFTGYCGYFARNFPFTANVLLPAAGAAGFTFTIWALAWVFNTLGAIYSVPLLLQAGTLMRGYLLPIFVLVLALGILTAYLGYRRRY